MKKWLIVVCCFALFDCARNRSVTYVPSSNVSEPAKVIERVIKSQPSAYTYGVPFEVSVKSDCIELRTSEPGGGFLFFSGTSPGETRSAIYYKNIGKIILNKNEIWYVEIIDRAGYWMYYVYSFDESEAKLFIDAMHTMMAKQ